MKPYPLYLNGEWVTNTPFIDVHNPANGELLGSVSTIDRATVAQAIQHAHTAFQAWRKQTGKARGAFLNRIAEAVEKRSTEIARIISLENGKPLAQSVGEVAMTVDHLRWFAEEARRAYGRIVPPQVDGKRHLVIKSPLGVVGAIGPWNFPLVLGIRKAAPALAAGCTVVLKPSELTPLSTLAFAECVAEAKLPAGVFQVVLGDAPEIGQEFLAHPLCRKVTFTGSTAVGRLLIAGAAHTIKPLALELGGHAPVLVFDDIDLPRAVEGVVIAKTRNTGQSCIAANRIYVQRSIYDQFLDAFVTRMQALKVGGAFEPNVEVGPLIDAHGLHKALEHIENAVALGARVLCGGKRWGVTGYFIEPTVLADVPKDALCMSEETFAPIAPVCAFETEEEALELANASPYGLSAYAFTGSLDRAFRLMEGLEAGTIGINDGVPSTSNCPFGGIKQSGWGRELGTEGMEAFLETKHVSLGLQI
ncbi:MAG: NAD-dependent succinate-semialdehyde dehydrogenase [Acidobacteria bacterium]|nr:NAD-dependent succinate-semialdehyde dehydrogenase [Acidobacteriota bacterium]MBI3425466.1 NAD-dependent succinate-semialdehyde dehydrogenase [Acidobacteriota bacterium]